MNTSKKRKKRKPKLDEQPPSLLAYWGKLTEGEINQINAAVIYRFNRNSPGLLPFMDMVKVCDAILSYSQGHTQKRWFFKLLHKLDSWKHIAKAHHTMRETVIFCNERRMLRFVPMLKRYPQGDGFKFRLPFDPKAWALVTPLPSDDLYRIVAEPRHIAPIRAWFEQA